MDSLQLIEVEEDKDKVISTAQAMTKMRLGMDGILLFLRSRCAKLVPEPDGAYSYSMEDPGCDIVAQKTSIGFSAIFLWTHLHGIRIVSLSSIVRSSVRQAIARSELDV